MTLDTDDAHAWPTPPDWPRPPLPVPIPGPHKRQAPLWKRALRGKKAITKHYRKRERS